MTISPAAVFKQTAFEKSLSSPLKISNILPTLLSRVYKINIFPMKNKYINSIISTNYCLDYKYIFNLNNILNQHLNKTTKLSLYFKKEVNFSKKYFNYFIN